MDDFDPYDSPEDLTTPSWAITLCVALGAAAVMGALAVLFILRLS